MRWYKDIQEILAKEPETWLAYLFGNQLNNIPHLVRNKPRVRGVFLRLLVYFYLLVRNLRLRKAPQTLTHQSPRYLVYCDTINQMNSLDSTVDALRADREHVLAITDRALINNSVDKSRYTIYGFGVLDEIKALCLLAMRGKALLSHLKKNNPAAADYYFNHFCASYIYLVYFYELLKSTKPEFVVTANDHNVSNRCLLAVAHHLGIKTVYIQHASVSKLFPALRVNYAFLDGQYALDIYRQCEGNQPPANRKVPMPAVFLSGQKKHLVRSSDGNRLFVGIATNTLDDPIQVIDLIKKISSSGLNICFRWHPGQLEKDIKLYKNSFSGNKNILLSDPYKESGSKFMSNIRYLVAGNSSIHLEAALAGVVPIYYELTAPDNPDYYGYVHHGLAKEVHTLEALLKVLHDNSISCEKRAVRYYSATYQTEWEGREGELVAKCLRSLAGGESADDLFGVVGFREHLAPT